MALHQLPATLRALPVHANCRKRSGDSHLTGGPIDVGTGLSLDWVVDWQWKWRTPPRVADHPLLLRDPVFGLVSAQTLLWDTRLDDR